MHDLNSSMKSELPLSHQEQKLLARALDSAVLLDAQLNLLLDAYDFYASRYGSTHPVQMNDLLVSIKALGTIPKLVSMNLTSWRAGIVPDISRIGFEVNVLNELILHMNTLYFAVRSKKIDLGAFSPAIVTDCMSDLKMANNVFNPVPT